MYLAKAVIYNRAPFDSFVLSFDNKVPTIFSGINGSGKTTLISYIVDSFYELAKVAYANSFEGTRNKYYRISSPCDTLKSNRVSFVYLRYILDNGSIADYIDIRGNCSEEEYLSLISMENVIPFNQIRRNGNEINALKKWSISDKKTIESIFDGQLMTYFPAYRFETPEFLNKPYQHALDYSLDIHYSGYLLNPIEVTATMPQIANWIMDVTLDNYIYHGFASEVFGEFNSLLTSVLSSKLHKKVRLGIGPRNSNNPRIAIMDADSNKMIYPNIMAMSSGELSLISLFGELIRQTDNVSKRISDVSGIVLIDEIDKHLHIRLQKEIIPRLLNLFPNVQFIISSHSPFFALGLEDTARNNYHIFDFDNHGLPCDPDMSNVYREAYDVIIEKNRQYKSMYEQIYKQLELGSRPLVITEGKTDWMHLKSAMAALDLDIYDTDIEILEYRENMGDSTLANMLLNYSRFSQQRKIIGMFDRDDFSKLVSCGIDSSIETKPYISLGNNVFAFAIPVVHEEIYGDKTSIEHYYPKENLLKQDINGRRLFLGNEFHAKSRMSKDKSYYTRFSGIENKVNINGIIDDKVYSIDDNEALNSLALSKNRFAELILEKDPFADSFDFSAFMSIFDIIKEIISL